MRKIWRKTLAYTLAVTMCFNTINVPVHAQESTISEVSTETETTGTTDGTDGSAWDQVTTKNVFEGENYRVTFTLTSHWDTGYNANVKLENTGDSTIQNWYLGFNYNNSITNIWNAEIFSKEDREYVIKNVGWNQDIAAGNSVEFGISSDHVFRGFPENYELIGTSTKVAEDDYTIQYIVDGDWGTGFYGSISITNNTDTALKDSKYHIPEDIQTETEKGATHKYITKDGLEAIYELLVDATSVENVTNNYQGTKVLPLHEYPKIGPTFNYAPNDDNKLSDASIAHYYFDMVPFYWWGGVRDE